MKHPFSTNCLGFTAPISILLMIATGGGILIKGLYRDVPDLVAQAKGQDLVSLVIALPLLLITALLARRGSLQAFLIWLGCIGYLVYTYVSYAFAIQYNPLFLVYIALLGCSLYALITGLSTIDRSYVKSLFSDKTPVKAVSLYLAALMVLFYFFWLSELIPALLAGNIPQSIIDDRTPTNAIHVLDMAWILPALGVTAFSLWRKQSLGFTLAGVSLPFFGLLVSAAFSMAALQTREGNSEAIPMIAMFGLLLASAVGMLAWYLKGLSSQPTIENSAAGIEPKKLQMQR